MEKVGEVTFEGVLNGDVIFYCPGCKYGHAFNVKLGRIRDEKPVPLWTWNGDKEKPTFHPSLVVNHDDPETRCHLYVKAGKILFLNDCYHELAGKTVDMVDYYP